MTMKNVVSFSGPHGGGKTYLIERLLKRHDGFELPEFELDFLSEFSSFVSLLDWERCLVRLYHRYFLSLTAAQRPADGRCRILSRGVLDSEAYIETYYRLGLMDAAQYRVLRTAIESIPALPPTVVLVPSEETLSQRLGGRIEQGVRSERDRVFRREDQHDFVVTLSEVFREFRDRDGVLYITDNLEDQQDEVAAWIRA